MDGDAVVEIDALIDGVSHINEEERRTAREVVRFLSISDPLLRLTIRLEHALGQPLGQLRHRPEKVPQALHSGENSP